MTVFSRIALRVLALWGGAPVLVALALLTVPSPHPVHAQTPSDGERAWQSAQAHALAGRADAALAAYGEALRLARQDRDNDLASAARLGMAEIWDVWRRCQDSARAAYEDAVRLAPEGEYAAADAFVIWLARNGYTREARALHARTYAPVEYDLPRTITRESVNFLLGMAAIQLSNESAGGALTSLEDALVVANRLAAGDDEERIANGGGVTAHNYWVLHDLAQLQLERGHSTYRPAAGRTLLAKVDAARAVSDNGGNPRFSVGRLADRVARERRRCTSSTCALPPLPTIPMCPSLVFRNVHVVGMQSDAIARDQTVIVANGLIRAIGPSARTPVPAGATIIDARGKYLMPGLGELHAHVPPGTATPEQLTRTLQLYMLGGVTTIRSMLGDPSHLSLRASIKAGTVVGPRLIAGGPSLNGNSVPTADAAKQLVAEQRVAGYDFLKIHPGVPRVAFDTAIATAKRLGLPYAGHVPLAVGWEHALASGYATIDHLDGFLEALLPSSSPIPAERGGFFGLSLVEHVDTTRIPALVARTKVAGVRMVPTMALMEAWVDTTPSSTLAARPEMQYWPAAQVEAWRLNKDNLVGGDTYTVAQRNRFVALRAQIARALYAGGVPFLLGSDAPQVWNVPGFSVHRELEALVAAGFSPYDALRSGTTNVAAFLGESDLSGVIAQGRRADLVLLDGNPLDDIRNTQRISGVMVNGHWISGAERARRLDALRVR